MYLRDAWYVAATSDEISQSPLARLLLEEPVVLWRMSDGAPVAFEDRCCHRHAPLSAGKVLGDTLQCGYHGLTFDRRGACVDVPSQARVPPDARVRAYPLVERYNWVWIWMGDPAAADEALIPETYWHESPDWCAVGDRFLVDCHYQSLIDIQLDNTHSRFVHPDTLGNDGSLRHDPKTARDGETLRNHRRMPDSDPPPIFARASGINGNADVWVEWQYTPRAGIITFDAGIAELGSGVFDGDRSKAVTMFNTHGITPETATTCHHFWVSARDFALDDEAIHATMAGIRDVFLEDVAMVEAQQRIRNYAPAAPQIDINADVPTIQARKLVDRLIAAQA
jgi:phenylpropionate dioxygenase-like ring-hydroxylating dioxygenase large terminal subunit